MDSIVTVHVRIESLYDLLVERYNLENNREKLKISHFYGKTKFPCRVAY